MTERLICGLILIVAITQFLPILGLLGVDKLNAAYGITITDPNLEILMRHRAVLFGLLGAFIAFAAFTPAYQPLAFIAAAISLLSFFWLVWSVGDPNPSIKKLVMADVVAAITLIAAVLLYYLKKPL